MALRLVCDQLGIVLGNQITEHGQFSRKKTNPMDEQLEDL